MDRNLSDNSICVLPDQPKNRFRPLAAFCRWLVTRSISRGTYSMHHSAKSRQSPDRPGVRKRPVVAIWINQTAADRHGAKSFCCQFVAPLHLVGLELSECRFRLFAECHFHRTLDRVIRGMRQGLFDDSTSFARLNQPRRGEPHGSGIDARSDDPH